jgi:hypothetical protein
MRSALLLLALAPLACSSEPDDPPVTVSGKLEALPVTISFPEGPVGAVTSTVVTIKNIGTGALKLTAIATTGPFTAPTGPIDLAPFASTQLTLQFMVPATGDQSGQLTITHDGSNGPSDVAALRGKGLSNEECYPCDAGPAPRCLASGDSVEYLKGVSCGEGDQCTFTGMTHTCEDGCNQTSGRCAIAANACGSPANAPPIAVTTRQPRRIVLGWAGDQYGALWNEQDGASGYVRFQRLSKNGERLGPTLDLSSNGSGGDEIAMVATPFGYGVVFPNLSTGEQGMSFALISKDGDIVAGPTGLGTDTRFLRNPAMAYNPTDREIAIVLSAQPRMPGTPGNIRFYRFDDDGARIGQFQTLSDPQTDSNYPQIAFSSGEYGVAYERINTSPLPGGVVWVGVQPNGLRQGPETDIVDGAGGVNYLSANGAVVAKGDRFGMLYSDRSTGFLNLFLVEVDINAQVSRGPIAVSQVSSTGGVAWQQTLVATQGGYSAAWLQIDQGVFHLVRTTIVGDTAATPVDLEASGRAVGLAANDCDVGAAVSINMPDDSVNLRAIP